ncbi:MAG TPA: hypothetical protein VIB00_17535, partial [Pyrinomonadaceae bacterium]
MEFGIWNLEIGIWNLEFGIWELFGIGNWELLSGDGALAKNIRLGRVVYPRPVGLRYLSSSGMRSELLDLMQP